MAGVLFGNAEYQVQLLEDGLNSPERKYNFAGALCWRVIEVGRAFKDLAIAVPKEISCDLNDHKYDANQLARTLSIDPVTEKHRPKIVEFITKSRDLLKQARDEIKEDAKNG